MMSTAWRGGALSDRATCVLAPNPGPMTLEGTNTWLLREPGSGAVTVVDPGPDDAGHVRAVVARAEADGGRVAGILLTHHHLDHAGAADRLAALTGAEVRGGGRAPLTDGEVLDGGPAVTVVATPGHTGDSVCLLAPDGLLLTGDTVLGRGSTVVVHPDGDLGAYLASLDRLAALVAGGVATLAPGHGPAVTEPAAHLAWLAAHRRERLAQVRTVLDGGTSGVEEVLTAVYGDLPPGLRPAARASVRAQLSHLGVGTGP